MSSEGIRVVGPASEDPEVLRQLHEHEQQREGNIARALTTPNPTGLAKFGVNLRVPGLMHGAMIARVMAAGKGNVAPEYQPFIYLFTLGAPLEKVYGALGAVEKDGVPAFMARVHEWFDSLNLPPGLSDEVLEAVVESFRLAQDIAPKERPAEGEASGLVIKKKRSRGSSSQPTGSPPNTGGASSTSGGK